MRMFDLEKIVISMTVNNTHQMIRPIISFQAIKVYKKYKHLSFFDSNTEEILLV